MAKNQVINAEHETLGPLVIQISSVAENQIKGLIPTDLAEAYSKKSNDEFLQKLYIENINNDRLTNIIVDLMTNPKLSSLSKLDIVNIINKKIENIQSRQSKQESRGLKSGDSITLEIFQKENMEDNIYYAEVNILCNKNEGTYAYVETNTTNPEFRHNGLQKLGFQSLEKYLGQNNIGQIRLDAQDLDANEFNLKNAYKNLGFSENNNGEFVKYIQVMERY